MMTHETDDGVYVVNDSIFATGEAHKATQEENLAEIQPRPINEILYIASIVAQLQFPLDVVNSILELAGVLLAFQAETSDFCRGRSNMNEEYVRLQLPTPEELQIPLGVDVSKCSLVVADCVSKDQGWATDGREHNGTYRESSSWCELVVRSTVAMGESNELARVPFYPNLRAGRNFRHHRRYFTSSAFLLRSLNLGDSVSIVLRSQYPGWTNSAKYGRLAVCFAVELNDEFSFADISFPESDVLEEESRKPSIPCCIQ
ncbi:uncharacterized protein PHALS_00612 [Plasmopara halstedii]|uniref:Uncharacterized protein n=1 Tax=Plasmopara halstedii TaxID=4781 RepID=A0A0P1B6L6_PLAHL|nr:uncharacterized protein PHALS_00612 [Plasmopara halstedii]CEG50468.1 hypothetical protein PHALS_00612 [Plasmopara halstedii]|eukprot:XP_024586837.1 hypothetical protein PHALS_00612 [Plasmopara halstedii]